MRLDLVQEPRGGGGSVEIRPHQQPRAGGGSKRHRHREFRVVASADTRVSLRPREIKHELAVGMRLDEGWGGGCEPGVIGQCDIGRIPAGAGADATGMLEGREELMAQEWIAIRAQRVPLPRVDLIDAVMNPGSGRRLRQECFLMSRASR